MGQPGRRRRIEERHPEDVAGNGEGCAGQGEGDGDVPEDDRERDQRGDLREQGQRETIGLVDEGARVFGDALVGVVDGAGKSDPVMRGMIEPGFRVRVRHELPPADQDRVVGEQLDEVRDDPEQGPDAEDIEKLVPERRGILVLQRVVHVAVEEGEAQSDADLQLVQHDQEDEERDRKRAEPDIERADRPEIGGRDLIGFEIGRGDAGDARDHRHEGDRVDQDREDADRRRQAGGNRRNAERSRPPAQLGRDRGAAEHQILDREDAGEYPQEEGQGRRTEGHRCQQQADDAHADHTGRSGLLADDQRSSRQQGDEDAQQAHGRESWRKTVKATIRTMSQREWPFNGSAPG